MSKFQFKKAERKGAHVRIALIGPSGSGKTYSALAIASGLGGKVAAIDTERGSMKLYADQFNFDVLELESFSPQNYMEAINSAAEAGYEVLVIDSFSHAWMGKDGALEQVDRIAKRSSSGNTWSAWRDVTPLHNQMIDTILAAPLHIVATMRSKSEWVIEKDERTGKNVPRKIGTSPQARDGAEFEFTVVGDMNLDHELVISKSRIKFLDGAVISKPGVDLGSKIVAWCGEIEVKEPTPTDEQLRALATAAKEAGWTNEQVKNLCESDYDVSPRNLTISQYNDIMQQIKDNPKGEEEN